MFFPLQKARFDRVRQNSQNIPAQKRCVNAEKSKKDDSYAGRLADLTFAFECAIIGRMFAERNLIPWKWGSGRVGTFFAAVCAEL